MSITATVTADAGPGQTVTAGVFSGVKSISFDPDAGTITLTYPDQTFKTFSTDGVTTFTVSISGRTWTVTIS